MTYEQWIQWLRTEFAARADFSRTRLTRAPHGGFYAHQYLQRALKDNVIRRKSFEFGVQHYCVVGPKGEQEADA